MKPLHCTLSIWSFSFPKVQAKSILWRSFIYRIKLLEDWMTSTFNSVKKCKKMLKNQHLLPLIFNLAVELCACNEKNQSREWFALSIIYNTAKFRIQYLCGLYTALEVARRARGNLFNSWMLKFLHHTQLHLGFKNIQEHNYPNKKYTLQTLFWYLFTWPCCFVVPIFLIKSSFFTILFCFFSQRHYSQKVLDKMTVLYLCFSDLCNQQHSKIVAYCDICTYC